MVTKLAKFATQFNQWWLDCCKMWNVTEMLFKVLLVSELFLTLNQIISRILVVMFSSIFIVLYFSKNPQPAPRLTSLIYFHLKILWSCPLQWYWLQFQLKECLFAEKMTTHVWIFSLLRLLTNVTFAPPQTLEQFQYIRHYIWIHVLKSMRNW